MQGSIYNLMEHLFARKYHPSFLTYGIWIKQFQAPIYTLIESIKHSINSTEVCRLTQKHMEADLPEHPNLLSHLNQSQQMLQLQPLLLPIYTDLYGAASCKYEQSMSSIITQYAMDEAGFHVAKLSLTYVQLPS